MADDNVLAPEIKIGRIMFRSWEHELQTGHKEASSVASAARVLPTDVTQPIYEIMSRWERDLLRSSAPLPPYGLRIRSVDYLMVFDSDYLFSETLRRNLPISQVCPDWENVAHAQINQGKYGIVWAPTSDHPILWKYEVIWRTVVYPENVKIDKLLGRFSPRYRSQTMFG